MMTIEQINNASFETLLRIYRFALAGDPQFIGKLGEYFIKAMAEKKLLEPDNGVGASKRVGW